MAANSTVSIVLQAKDWELLMGIIFNNADPEIQDVLFQLSNFYKSATTKPLQTDSITVVTTESVVIRLSVFLYGTTVSYVTKDIGGSPFSRIMTALRLLNNTADNYISTTLATNDANYAAQLTVLKKAGRKYTMILQYDNN